MSAEHKDFYNYYTLFSAKMGRGSILNKVCFLVKGGEQQKYIWMEKLRKVEIQWKDLGAL